MNKIVLSICCILLTIISTFAQESYFDKDGKVHFLGPVTVSQLEQADSMAWFSEGFESYDAKVDKAIKKSFKDVKVKVFIGTWCGDTKKLFPKFAKVWEANGLAPDQMEIVALHDESEKYKQSPGKTERTYGVHRVPTFVFERNGKEIGRIVERPMTDLHTDMKQIALGIPTNPRYRGVALMQAYFSEKSPDSYLQGINAPYQKAYREISTSSEFNTYGYVLKAAGEMEKAEAVFYLNTYLFRSNPNTHDSLGELYFDMGRKDDAKKHYAQVLELDPKNEHALEMMAKLK